MEFLFGDVADGVEVVIADVFGIGAVGVDVDEAGECVLAFGVEGGLCGGKDVLRGEGVGDDVVFDEDGAVFDFYVWRDDVGVFY